MLESYLVSVATKSTIILAAGLLLLRGSRCQSPATRHLISLSALVSAAIVPLLALWSPPWSFLISIPAAPGAASVGNEVGATSWNWPIVFLGVWAAGSFVMAARAAGGWVLLLRSRRRSSYLLLENGIEVCTGDVSTPLACGVLRPLILLPAAARNWDAARLRAVLLHESAHVWRHDCLAKYIAQGARVLLWWNPLAWSVAGHLNREQELACDEAVLAAGIPADAYASVLLEVAREQSSGLLLGCAMVPQAGILRLRIEELFQTRRRPIRSARGIALAIPLVLVLMTAVSCAEKVYKIGPGIVPPKVAEKSDPQYTQAAREAKLQGPVVLSLVVGVDQMAHDVKVTKSLDPGLDANAVAAIKTWKFEPGTKDGKPVPVRAIVQVNFKLL